jgi:hypothetical protein
MRLMAVVVAGFALAAAPAAAEPKLPKPPKPSKERVFEVGAAKRLTNPTAGERLCLGGYGSCPDGGGRTMTHVRDDMYARALAVSVKDDGLILVHTTNIGLFASYKADGVGIYHLRQEVGRRTGVPADRVIVQADHSHSGPDTIGIWGGVPESWLRYLQAQAVDAAVAAWEARRPARVYVGTADGPGITSSYQSEPNLSTDDEFRLLWANDLVTGERIATLSNYSPHATVLGSSNKGASGDWPEWAAQIAEARFGGTGLGGVGTLGREDFGTDESRTLDEQEAEARARLDRMMSDALAAGAEVPARDGVDVQSVYFTEPIAQPILFANLLPEGAVDAGGYDISIDRDTDAPWLKGTTLGTYAGAARIGDVFFGMSPGEPFPQIQEYLRDEGGVTGARAYFHLGATNDFLGYMVRPLEAYPQVAVEGAGFLIGCPEEEIFKNTGVPYDEACTDHWTLMVSPTIGSHVACTIQDAAVAVGFGSGARDDECGALTALDGTGAPAEENAG